jgi:hygromycin-B 7''-O-kinase
MKHTDLNILLSSVQTIQEYETIKQNIDILKKIAKEILSQHQLPEDSLTLFSEGTNIVFACGNNRVIKIYPPFHQDQFQSELLVLQHLQGKLSVKTPRVEYDGKIYDWPYIVMTQLKGTPLESLWDTMNFDNKSIIIRELGALIHEVHSLSTDGLEAIDCHWDKFIDAQINHCVEQHKSTHLSEKLIQQIPTYLESIKTNLPRIKKPVLLTGEYTPMNFLVKQKAGIWHIDALIDFGDAMLGLREYDLLGPGAFLIEGDKKLLREFLIAYGYSPDSLTQTLSYQLTALLLLHKYSNLHIQVRIKNWKQKVTRLKDLENLLWGF